MKAPQRDLEELQTAGVELGLGGAEAQAVTAAAMLLALVVA